MDRRRTRRAVTVHTNACCSNFKLSLVECVLSKTSWFPQMKYQSILSFNVIDSTRYRNYSKSVFTRLGASSIRNPDSSAKSRFYLSKLLHGFVGFRLKIYHRLNISIKYLIVSMRVVKSIGDSSEKPIGISLANLILKSTRQWFTISFIIHALIFVKQIHNHFITCKQHHS